MELEMGMQLHSFILCQKEQNQVRIVEDWLPWCIWCVCTEYKLKLLTTMMHMATATITPIYYTNQTQEIPSTLSEKCLYLYYMHKVVLNSALVFGVYFDIVYCMWNLNILLIDYILITQCMELSVQYQHWWCQQLWVWSVHLCTSDVNIKVTVYLYLWHCTIKGVHSLLGKMESTQIKLEQNSAYQGINTFPSSLTREDMEPCPAYGIVL